MSTLLALALIGCAKQQPPPPAAPRAALTGSHVTVETGLIDALPPRGPEAERAAMLAVLKEADAACRVCYERAVARDPYAYGDIQVLITLGADGSVAEARPRYSTTGDPELDACVLERVRHLRFPPPSRDGLTLSYPFIFTSDLTPAEVTRSLLVQHGLAVPLADTPVSFDSDDEPDPAQGEDGWWESW